MRANQSSWIIYISTLTVADIFVKIVLYLIYVSRTYFFVQMFQQPIFILLWK